ncbi:flavin monoamine oxidase family protein [Archangium sp.]|uniref:flavin monoamine oxidase family protein n=1 Tax=Archangium sp. TaxID=1872627 RepID=UPI002D6B0277|nr:FAD-dependent oxidoreductase [Archangium sp.]HYO52940.1 FAD-dependent oxidoreductase [Archangium sp.]
MDSLADLGDLDAMSGARLLRDHGASDAVVDYLGLGFLDVSGEGLEACSALLMLRDLALRLTSTGVLRVRGGNDGIPRVVAARLGAAVRTNARVLRVSADAAGARVEVSRDGGREVVECDYVVLAVPLRALARIEFAPALSAAKARAVATVPYASVTRTYLQVSARAWENRSAPAASSGSTSARTRSTRRALCAIGRGRRTVPRIETHLSMTRPRSTLKELSPHGLAGGPAP